MLSTKNYILVTICSLSILDSWWVLLNLIRSAPVSIIIKTLFFG